MTIEEILTKKRRGDYDLIAEMTGYDRETVKSQLLGKRTLKDKVRNAAIKVIENRKKLFNQK
jgi:hypothetical protein